MAQPKKRITRARKKQTYLGSGAGSMRSGTGTTAKKSKSTQIKKTAKEFVPFAVGAGSALKGAAEAVGLKTSRPPKSPASGVGRVFKTLRVPALLKKRKRAIPKRPISKKVIRKKAKR
jgi:hypothetical protein